MGKEFQSVTVHSRKWGRQGRGGHVQETGTSSSVVRILPHRAAGEEKVLGLAILEQGKILPASSLFL